jgi:serine/threonine protein kinase/Tfp pilus assembly protein PilF
MDVVEKARIIAKKMCPQCNEEFASDDDVLLCPKDHTPLEQASKEKDPLVGTVVAERYEILEMIGSGGWALIYKAKQKPLNRLVAIKILHGHLAGDPEKVKRFKREAEAATKLVHENVGSVFDYGLLPEGQPYMVMEYLQGITLQDVLKRDQRMPLDKAVEVFRQVCHGLALAHDRNIVHRDVKPSNIYMVDDESQVKILDFGLAKLLASDESVNSISLTQTGQTIGTPSYMSPEQCTGFPLDSRSDLYSVGCVMFEMLTGKRAFEGRNLFETMSQQINIDVSFEAAGAAQTVPVDLQLVVMKALAKNPQERYQTAKELDAALEEVLDRLRGNGRGILLPRLQAFVQKHRRAARKLTREPMIAVVVLMSVVLAGVAGWRLFSDNSSADVPVSPAISYNRDMAEGQRKFDKTRFDEAAQAFAQAAKQSVSFGEGDSRHIAALAKQAEALKRCGNASAALAVEQQIIGIKQRYTGVMYGDETQNALRIAVCEKRLKADAGDKAAANELCGLRNNQAQLMLTHSRFEEAENQLQRALKLERATAGMGTAAYATTVSNLAYIYSNNNENEKAEALYKEALALREKLFAPADPSIARSLRNLGDFYLKQGQFEKAQGFLARSLHIYEQVGTEADVAWDLNNLGVVYLQEKEYGRAQVALESALRLRQRISKDNPDYIDIGRTIHNIGILKMAQGNVRDAVSRYEEALRIYETQLSPTHADTLKCARDLANAYIQQQDFKRAKPLLLRITSALDPADSMAKEAAEGLLLIQQKSK